MTDSVMYQKQVTVVRECDVLVVGAGPAGVCAAVSAAREGAKVILCERYGSVGGMLTMGNVDPILGEVSSGTYYDEIVKRLAEIDKGTVPTTGTRIGREVPVNREVAKIVLDKMLSDAGVELWVGAAFVDALTESGKVTGAIFATQNGLKAIRAKITIDSTGDACVAASAGAEIEIGRESDGGLQPMTLEFTVTGVDESIAISVWGGSDPIKIPAGEFAGMEYRELCKQKNREGELPEFVTIVRLHKTSKPGERSVNATQVNGLSPLDPSDMGKAEIELRDQIKRCVDFLQKYIPGFENCSIKASADTVGVRESRRVRGIEYIVDSDVENGRMREDGIVHNAWFLIDIHNPKGGGQAEGYSKPAQPYDIPYGALVPIKIDGLLIAGRPISGTHRAHASWRVMAICMAMGEAAGVAASKCTALDCEPRDLDPAEVRKILAARGVEL
ncbi:MAG: FAD-dependent oxidoreductase [Clostridia bacterium]|nr:FAD-dependent oxidoreductase [Clostridia bacterium]